MTTIYEARRKNMERPVIRKKALQQVLDAKVTYKEIEALWNLCSGVVVAEGKKLDYNDLVLLASRVYPQPLGRQQIRDTANKMSSLIERIMCMEDHEQEPRLARWKKVRDGIPLMHRALIYAMAKAPLKFDNLHKIMKLDVDDLVRFAHEGELKLDLAADDD